MSSILCLFVHLDVQAQMPSRASYRVTFQSSWSADTHPQDFPSNAHFSGLIGATHDDRVSFWNLGELASPGIESMAETGSKSPLSSEIDIEIVAERAEFTLSGGGISRSPGTVELDFEVSETFPFVTLVSMVAPSPDWFVGVTGLRLWEDGEWVSHIEVPLEVLDAGTDDGVSYTSPDAEADPPHPVSELTAVPFDVEQQVGTFAFELLSAVGVEEVPSDLEGFRLYPNPAADRVVIEWSGQSGGSGATIDVFDILGRRSVETSSGLFKNRVELDLGSLPRGLYVVRVMRGGTVQTRTLVVSGRE